MQSCSLFLGNVPTDFAVEGGLSNARTRSYI